eukprot:6429304-Amphidinium_carterae.2
MQEKYLYQFIVLPSDRSLPDHPSLADINPWKPDEDDRRNKFIEAMKFYAESAVYHYSIR